MVPPLFVGDAEMADLKSLREERSKLIVDARALVDKAETEKRKLTTEEDQQYSTMFSKADELRKQIVREEELREVERDLAKRRDEEERTDPERQETAADKKGMTGFRSWLMNGTTDEEFRSLSQGANVEGGYLVSPQAFIASLLKGVDDDVVVRRLGNVIQMPAAKSIGVPTLDADPADADWTSELATGSEDSTMAFGKREMRPHPVAKRIKISNLLLRNSILPAEQLVMDRLRYKFSVTQEKAYLLGDGAQKPLGLFTASNDGVPTSRDVSTDNTSTSITTDGLKNTKYSLKAPYQKTAQWLFHRDAVKQIAKLKDGENRYLWQDSIRENEPDTLLGRPVNQSEYVPNTFTTGLYVGMFADFSYYWILDSLQLQMQRLVELYAETNQTGFIGRYEGDGAPVLPEAFARVKLG
jgi:HK97 family phage major capsid protein